MIKSSITRFLVLVFTMTGFLWASAQENDSLKILWIGNSYTYYNNLPALVTQLAGEQGLKLSPVSPAAVVPKNSRRLMPLDGWLTLSFFLVLSCFMYINELRVES